MEDLDQLASTISTSQLPGFITTTRLMTNELEVMSANTPIEGQSMGAAKILRKYGCA